MNTIHPRPVILAMLLVLAACGDATTGEVPGATATTPNAPGGEPAVCAHLRTVHEIDAAMNQAMDEVVADLERTGEAAAFSELQAIVAEADSLLADVTSGYDAALEVSPADLRDDLSTLREGTVVLWEVVIDLIVEADSADDFAASFEAELQDPGFLEQTLAAATATLRLDEFTVSECGFRLSR